MDGLVWSLEADVYIRSAVAGSQLKPTSRVSGFIFTSTLRKSERREKEERLREAADKKVLVF